MSTMSNTPSGAGAARRPRRAGRLLRSATLVLVCVGGGSASLLTSDASASRIATTQELAVLDVHHTAHRQPSNGSPAVGQVSAYRPITGERTELPIVGHAGTGWLKVMLPGRPNSSTGWIRRAATRETSTGWHIVVRTWARTVTVYYHGRRVEGFPAVVGKPSTPTPRGTFFVEENVRMPVSMAGGPFALALSARSNVLQDFDGGPGQIGIHGRDGLGGTLGQAESHGCMRLATGATWRAPGSRASRARASPGGRRGAQAAVPATMSDSGPGRP
jgi:lipoprotein-anchoring transpeptidase ErfK/SrfK